VDGVKGAEMTEIEQLTLLKLLKAFVERAERDAFIYDARSCSICHKYTGENFLDLEEHDEDCTYRVSVELLRKEK
jgi:hypothetical protein